MTRLCVPIFFDSIEQAKRDIATAVEAGADIVELRLDRVTNPVDVDLVRRGVSLPIILTCRSSTEGGESDRSDGGTIALLNEAAAAGDAYVDVELRALRQVGAGISHQQVIVSAHDFAGRPQRLYNLVEDMNRSAGSINKIAWRARSIRDNLEAFELLQTRQKPTIALCMGEAGLISRVLAKKFGAFLTFASLSREASTAPGQPTIEELKRLYRWDAVNEKTRVHGVVGSPIAHSMSPAVHNAAFDATGFDGLYVPFLVEPGYESFKAFMESFVDFQGLDLSGLSITIPHKENALQYLRWKGATVEELAQRIGAVNTIAIDRTDPRSTRLAGFNTDYSAILETITTTLGISRGQLADLRIAVIGAGGTGRTAVAALADCGATIVVYNRTRARADALAEEFDRKSGKVVSARLEKLCDSCCQVYINTTSVGMHPNVDATPLGDAAPAFGPDNLVFDTIYNPPLTKLLRRAQDAGAKTVGGTEMFVRQAARQFELWTGSAAPVAVMRRAIESRLTPAQSA